jgi:hypothetical protein
MAAVQMELLFGKENTLSAPLTATVATAARPVLVRTLNFRGLRKNFLFDLNQVCYTSSFITPAIISNGVQRKEEKREEERLPGMWLS